MNGSELIAEVSRVTDFNKKKVAQVLSEVAQIVYQKLSEDEPVHVPGLGKFRATVNPGRVITSNPSTGRPVHVESRKVPRFSASQPFKKALKEGI